MNPANKSRQRVEVLKQRFGKNGTVIYNDSNNRITVVVIGRDEVKKEIVGIENIKHESSEC